LETLTGDEIPDRGTILIPNGTSVAYVPQSIENIFSNAQDRTIIEYFYKARGLDGIQARMKELEILFGDVNNQKEELINEYGALQTQFEQLGGYTVENDALSVMKGIGFGDQVDLNTSIFNLSGGEKTKLFLAQSLLSESDLLLLDEPSNHLDQESVTWLSTYLKNYKGALIIISHKPDFIDPIVEKVIELDNQKVSIYQGNYTEYTSKKNKREAEETKKEKRQDAEVARLTEVVNRLRAGDRAKTSKDRQGKLEKITEGRPGKKTKRKNVRAVFEIGSQSGLEILETSGLQKNYGEVKLDYSNIDIKLQRGEKIAIVGQVGVGKSTLLKIVAGIITPDFGSFKFGHNINIGYYSQEMESLDPDRTVLEEIFTISSGENEQQMRAILGSFMFLNDDVFKKVGVLSYGERSRLMLAKLALKKHNFLILDEPSNHLDVETRNMLAEKLKGYQGSILLVSHDEEFMKKVGLTRVIKLPEGKVEWVVREPVTTS